MTVSLLTRRRVVAAIDDRLARRTVVAAAAPRHATVFSFPRRFQNHAIRFRSVVKTETHSVRLGHFLTDDERDRWLSVRTPSTTRASVERRLKTDSRHHVDNDKDALAADLAEEAHPEPAAAPSEALSDRAGSPEPPES